MKTRGALKEQQHRARSNPENITTRDHLEAGHKADVEITPATFRRAESGDTYVDHNLKAVLTMI